MALRHWFVYYKIDEHAVDGLAPRLRRLVEEVETATGVTARLMQRRDGGQATLLEVYEGIEDEATFEAALAAALGRAELPAGLMQQRRSERFEDL